MKRTSVSSSRIIRVDGRRYTADGRFRIGCRFGLMWVAYSHPRCLRAGCYTHPLGCYCQPVRLPGGVSGHAFNTLKGIQAALRKLYAKKGWPKTA